jgi:hypothetical protein
MPKIRREELPEHLLRHLALRVRERKITSQQLGELSDWLESEPIVAAGGRFKRFPQFTPLRQR